MNGGAKMIQNKTRIRIGVLGLHADRFMRSVNYYCHYANSELLLSDAFAVIREHVGSAQLCVYIKK